MRTDVRIDRKFVRCPNASHGIAFDKWRAQVGDLILATEGENGRTIIARMIGRIAYDPLGKSTGHIVAVVLNAGLSHTFERWIDPKDVTRVEPIGNEYINRRAVMEWFLSDDLVRVNVEEVRRCVSDGWSTLAKYREKKAEDARNQAEFKERHKDCETTPCAFCVKFRLNGAKEK